MLTSFNLYKYYPEIQGHALYKKYQVAILEFYQQRSRPADNKILRPTLLKCGVTFTTDAKVNFDETRNFSPQNMVLVDKFK
jgi:hypothetical protein